VGAAILLPTAAALFTPHGAGGEGGLLPAGVAGGGGRTLGAPLVGLLGVLGGALVVLFIALALPVATVGWNPARVLARSAAAGWARFRERRGAPAGGGGLGARGGGGGGAAPPS